MSSWYSRTTLESFMSFCRYSGSCSFCSSCWERSAEKAAGRVLVAFFAGGLVMAGEMLLANAASLALKLIGIYAGS